jgi:hypothetical protein
LNRGEGSGPYAEMLTFAVHAQSRTQLKVETDAKGRRKNVDLHRGRLLYGLSDKGLRVLLAFGTNGWPIWKVSE